MRNLRAEALQIYFSVLENLSIPKVIQERIRVESHALLIDNTAIDLNSFEEVVLVGLGKASIQMASPLAEMLRGEAVRGVLVSSRFWDCPLPSGIRTIIGGHPLPNEGSLFGATEIQQIVRSCSDKTLLIFLVSGGGSSLVELPISDSISVTDLQELNRVLVESSAPIQKINTVRKFFSQTKGGKLGYLARDTRTVALYLSDVNSGDLQTIASNPLLPERISRHDLEEILDEYALTTILPVSVRDVLLTSSQAEPDLDWSFSRGITTVLLADNAHALKVAHDAAVDRGYAVEVCDDLIEQDYQSIANRMAERLMMMQRSHPSEPLCVLSGGEASCPVRGDGVGGRNQEFVLYSAASLRHCGFESNAICLSAGSDGVDGNSIAVGAVLTPDAAERASQSNCDPSAFIENSDSHTYFSRAGGLVVTGPTGNNVRDIRMMLAC